MRINSISSCAVYSRPAQKKVNNNKNNYYCQASLQNQQPNFKGCNIFKIAGCILGAAAVAVLAPSLAAIGLAGLGAMPGALAGASIDDKIDEKNKKS